MRVVVAVGDLLVRHGLVTILKRDPSTHVVGVAADLATGRRLMRELESDVLIVSANLPPLREAGAPLLIQEARASGIRTIVLADDHDTAVADILLGDDAGGWGWLVRDQLADPSGLLAAVARVHRGGTVIDDAVVERLASRSRRREYP